jgi:hypothetical protein
MPVRLPPAPHRGPRANPRAEFSSLSWTPYRDRPAYHFRISVSGLDRCLSPVLSESNPPGGNLFRRPARRRRPVARGRAVSRRPRRFAAAPLRSSHPGCRLAVPSQPPLVYRRAWRRDPLGPRFQTNLVRAQRFLQISAAMPGKDGAYRLAPIAFLHTPTPPKPKRKASAAEWAQYRGEASASRLSLCAAQQMIQLRQALDQDAGGQQRTLWLAFDGGYTNSTVLKQIPPHTTCIGRIRKDAQLCFLPPIQLYGKRAAARFDMVLWLPALNSSAPMTPNPGKP